MQEFTILNEDYISYEIHRIVSSKFSWFDTNNALMLYKSIIQVTGKTEPLDWKTDILEGEKRGRGDLYWPLWKAYKRAEGKVVHDTNKVRDFRYVIAESESLLCKLLTKLAGKNKYCVDFLLYTKISVKKCLYSLLTTVFCY